MVAACRFWEALKALVASLTPYTVDTPLPMWASSRLREERLAAEQTESLRAGEQREFRSSLVLEAAVVERVSECVLDLS